MKLRIKGNSLRLRLLQSEVARLEAAGTISESIRFGTRTDQELRYSIAVTDGVDDVDVEFSDNQILIMFSESIALEWCGGNEVGIERKINIGDDETLDLLIEKDFVCLDRPEDPDRHDAYPNPHTECKVEENE